MLSSREMTDQPQQQNESGWDQPSAGAPPTKAGQQPPMDEPSESGRRRADSRSRSGSRARSVSRGRRSPERRSSPPPRGSQRSDRPAPEPCNVLGVFGLSFHTRDRDLEDLFSKYGKLEKVVLVMDRFNERSRGFGFVYFERIEDAIAAREAMNDAIVDERRVRVDFSTTQRPHDRTPGYYAGRPTLPPRRRSRSRSPGGYRRRRSPSPYRRRRSPSPYRERRRSPSPYRERRRSPSPYRERRRSPSPYRRR